MEAFWEGLLTFLSHPTVVAILKALVAAWVAERMEFLARERRQHDLKSAEAIETQGLLPHKPHHAKDIFAASPEGRSVEFNSALDRVSPLFDQSSGEVKKRVSTKRKIGRFLLKCLPVVSRFVG